MTYHCFLLSHIFQSFMPLLWVQTKAAMVRSGVMAHHWFNTPSSSDEIRNDRHYTSTPPPPPVCLHIMRRDNFIFCTFCLTLLQSYKRGGGKGGVSASSFSEICFRYINYVSCFVWLSFKWTDEKYLASNDFKEQRFWVSCHFDVSNRGRWPNFVNNLQINWSFNYSNYFLFNFKYFVLINSYHTGSVK